MHCFPGSLQEMRAHASSGNMRPPACISSADGHNNSCPQVLHSQVGALLHILGQQSHGPHPVQA